MLSRILKLAFEGGFVQKVGPWNLGIACLQYADDTLMLVPPDLVSIKKVKILQYIFELLSGLSINFNKSSLYQLGPPCLDLAAVSGALHCKIGSFPFPHLGLSLKPTTFSKEDWQPLLDRIDKRLAAQKGHSLSRGGRLILVNSVLTSLSLYFMSFFYLPQWVVEHIDRLRRAFFWIGESVVTGGQCLVIGRFFVLHVARAVLGFVDCEILISLSCLNGGGSF